MSDEKNIVITNVIEVSSVLLEQMSAMANKLNSIAQLLESLPSALSTSLAAEIQLHRQLEKSEPRTYRFGASVPETYASPEQLEYNDCRNYVHGFVNWLHARWDIPVQSAWHLLYNDLSDYLDFNVWANRDAFQRLYPSRSCLDMLDAKGYMRVLATLAFKKYGSGQALTMRYDTRVTRRVDLTPVGERTGQTFEQTFGTRRKVGKTRKARESKIVTHVADKVEAFKEQQEQNAKLASLNAEYSPETVAARADLAEAQLSELSSAERPQQTNEPWTTAQQ